MSFVSKEVTTHRSKPLDPVATAPLSPRFQRGVLSPRALRVASATLETLGPPSFRHLCGSGGSLKRR